MLYALMCESRLVSWFGESGLMGPTQRPCMIFPKGETPVESQHTWTTKMLPVDMRVGDPGNRFFLGASTICVCGGINDGV